MSRRRSRSLGNDVWQLGPASLNPPVSDIGFPALGIWILIVGVLLVVRGDTPSRHADT
jgi:hypothetical protein